MLPPLARFQTLDHLLPDLRSEHWSELEPPKSEGLVAHVDASFMKQVFHVAQRKRETNVVHYRQADNLSTRLEVAKGGALGHAPTLRDRPARLKTASSDSTRVEVENLTKPVKTRIQVGRTMEHFAVVKIALDLIEAVGD